MLLLSRYRFLLLGLSLYIHCNVISQIHNYRFNHISINEGLSQSSIFSIHQGKSGFIWVGTQDGLNKFDGYQFEIFKNDIKNPYSLTDNSITCLLEDDFYKLWIGTQNGGLNCYDIQTGTFNSYTFSESENTSLNSNHIKEIHLDNLHNLWILTDKNGIYNIKNNTTELIKIDLSALKLPQNTQITTCIKEKEQELWLGLNSNTIINYNLKTKKHFKINLSKEDALKNYEIVTFFKSKISNKLYAANNEQVFEIDQNEAKRVPLQFNIPSISKIIEDQKGDLWISSYGSGLFYHHFIESKTYKYTHNDLIPESISLDNIPCIFMDQSQVLWVGTYGSGIDQLSLQSQLFKLYRYEPNNNETIQSKSLRAIYDDGQNLFIGGYGGLDCIHKKTKKIIHYNSPEHISNHFLLGNNIYCIFPDLENENVIWIGYEGQGLSRFDWKQNTFKHFPYQFSKQNLQVEFPASTVFKGIDDGKGNVWLGTNMGLIKLNKANFKFKVYQTDKNNSNSISSNDVRDIVIDSKGNLWLALIGGGLNYFDTQKEKFTNHILKSPETASKIDRIRCIQILSENLLWIGTEGFGIVQYNSKTKELKFINESNGLPNDVVYGLLVDQNNNIWCSTNNGLAKINRSTWDVQSFNINNGLQSNEFNGGAFFKNDEGIMYFGGIDGLNEFDPQLIRKSLYEPQIRLTSFKKFNKEFKLNPAIGFIDKLALSYKDQVISFTFSGLDYSASNKIEYAYKLVGFDEDWNFIRKRHEVTYTNLDPGDYVLQIKCTNADGVWISKPYELQISIAYPFWQTWWFRVISILFIVFCWFLFYKYRTYAIRQQNQQLEKVVKERTLQLKATNVELEKLSIVAQETDNAVIICDKTGKLEWVNNAFEKMFGYNLESFIEAKKSDNLVGVSSNPEIKKLIEQTIQLKQSTIYESVNKTNFGTEIWVQSTLTNILDETGEIKKIIVIDSDITDRKRQEVIIQEKNKDIIDSINYAKMIQESILPSMEDIQTDFPKSFIFYKPKDIVSGDFYWHSNTKLIQNDGTEQSLIAIADCTGHGVPGGFMSMIGIEKLNQIFFEKKVFKPSEILTNLNRQIRKSLHQDELNSTSKDGMDIAIISINKLNNVLHYAGANRPLYIIREKNTTIPPTDFQYEEIQNHFLIELKANRTSIAGPTPIDFQFDEQEIQLYPGDKLYLFSDGFPDQFGGEKGKKFMTKRLKQWLVEHHSIEIQNVHPALIKTFNDWKAAYAQIDDVLFMGIEIE
jgi:PAS domain S-box-containing protein